MKIKTKEQKVKNLSYFAFTLIELMIALLIISSVLIVGFITYSRVGIGKFGLIEQTDILENDFYFSERLFQLVKEGGSIDYEEYFNRMVIGNETQSGHYSKASGFGNFGYNGIVSNTTSSITYGTGFYYCRSGDGSENKMGSEGCYNSWSLNNMGDSLGTTQQRYGQYSFQFIDYNSNYNGDLGDENGDGNIIGDDDDEYLGLGPTVFETGIDVKELYLISGDKKRRTYFRWNIKKDEFLDKNGNTTINCNLLENSNTDLCRGTIEFLRLEGRDWGMNHDINGDDIYKSDGVIDTWIIDKDFVNAYSGESIDTTCIGNSEVIAGCVNTDDFWQPLFPTSINVTDFKVFVYPNINQDYAWKDDKKLSPYVILNYKIKPSWEIRSRIKSEGKEVNINSTINLTDIFSR